MIKLYGNTLSRAVRCFWLAYELGLDFELVPTQPATDAKSPEYLALNPNGRVPVLVDGDLVLFESLAINLYLAKRYGGATRVGPESLEEDALMTMWTLWAATECEPHAYTLIWHRLLHPEAQRDTALADAAAESLKRPLGALEAHLQTRSHLVGERFTVADLNVAGVLSWARLTNLDFSAYPQAKAWLMAALERPAQKRSYRVGK